MLWGKSNNLKGELVVFMDWRTFCEDTILQGRTKMVCFPGWILWFVIRAVVEGHVEHFSGSESVIKGLF